MIVPSNVRTGARMFRVTLTVDVRAGSVQEAGGGIIVTHGNREIEPRSLEVWDEALRYHRRPRPIRLRRPLRPKRKRAK